jgi:type II secretion system protein G
MEEKKVHKRNNSLWPIFNSRFFNKSIFGKFNAPPNNFLFGFLTKPAGIKLPEKTASGFTLIELVVVIGILAILAVAGLFALNPIAQFQKANDARRKADLSQIQKALETYYQDNGSYPIEVSLPYKIIVPGTPPTTIEWGQSWSPYMNLVPADPASSKNYVYYSTGQSYFLYASLDVGGTDPQACNKDGSVCSKVPSGATCGGGICNFGVSSPNVSP